MSHERTPADPDTTVEEPEPEPHDRPEVTDIPEIPDQPPPRRPDEVVPEVGTLDLPDDDLRPEPVGRSLDPAREDGAEDGGRIEPIDDPDRSIGGYIEEHEGVVPPTM